MSTPCPTDPSSGPLLAHSQPDADELPSGDPSERLAADRRLIEAYLRLPEDPALIESAARLATRTAPEW